MNQRPDLRLDFWDVGQGDCSVITLPDGRLILIDVGGRSSPVVEWLADRRPAARIAAIILTHNDSDHAGALPSILDDHAGRIERLWMLLDRPKASEPFAKIFRRAYADETGGLLSISRLEAGSVIWEDPATDLSLRPIYPNFSENILSTNPNNSSGLIVLSQGAAIHAVWPGDLPIGTVARKLDGVNPALMVGPHHGGPTDFKRGLKRTEFRKSVATISPAFNFISVGTKNSYNHPRPGYLALLAQNGCRVCCSQITTACDRFHLQNGVPVFDGSGALGLRSPRTGTPCRGAVRFTLSEGVLSIDEFAAIHMERVQTLRRPQCFKGAGWKKGEPPPFT